MQNNFTQEYIHEVKKNTDIVELAKEYVRDLKPVRMSGAVWQGTCPHPDHEDRSPSFTVYVKDQSWVCYGCHCGKKNQKENFGTDCIAMMQWLKGLDFKDAISFLAKRAGIAEPDSSLSKHFEANERLAIKYHEALEGHALDYLYSRGLNVRDISKWCIGFDGEKITFPLYDRYRRILGFSRRSLSGKPKYVNSSNNEVFNKSYYFYGVHQLDLSYEEVRIVEGCMDVILATKYGAKNVVGILGSALAEGHIDILKNWNTPAVLCMDGDKEGIEAAHKHIESLSNENIYSKLLILPENKDMADLALSYTTDIESVIKKNSITYGYYAVQNLLERYTSQLYELRLNLQPELQEVLLKVPKVEREALSDFILDQTGINLKKEDHN